MSQAILSRPHPYFIFAWTLFVLISVYILYANLLVKKLISKLKQPTQIKAHYQRHLHG